MNNTTASALHIHVDIPSLRVLIVFLCCILYLFGYIGCLLSIVTFSSKKLRRHSTGFLFLIMAFVDIFNLLASLQYFLDVIYQINVYSTSIHWCRFLTISNYELYFAFSWIFVFISVDRWIKVEWPTRSQTICTRKRFIYLCLSTLILSLIQNSIYTFLCLTKECKQKNLICEIFIHVIYITIYMAIPIALILISISRTCLITLHLKKRFRPPSQQSLLVNHLPKSFNLNASKHLHTNNSTIVLHYQSTSHVPSSSASTSLLKLPNNHQSINRPTNYSPHLRRRRSPLDTQMVILISINVAPFIIVHIITEIAYLFEKYSPTVAQSRLAQLFIILIYLSWYLISAIRFYTNCLLSRIYREEFKNRLYMLRHGCKPGTLLVDRVPSRPHSSRPHLGSIVNGVESTITPATHT